MSLPSDLLAQARHLINKEPRRPKQASLRRGVSAAYYALFHKLTDASSRFLVGGAGPGRQELRQALRRSFVHSDMKSISNSFAGGTPPQVWQSAAGAVSADLRRVAETFVELQEARHEADYDHTRTWTRQEARDLVQRAEHATFQAWDRAKAGRDAAAYLTALLAKSR
jgi:uncharacterized protein (UPF0332 family)